MRAAATATVAVLAALVLVLLPAPPARACSCEMKTPEEHLHRADVAFLGRVRGSATIPNNGSGPVLWLFDVDQVFKGDVHAQQGVASRPGSGSCGLDLERGRPVLVFARSDPQSGERRVTGAVYASICEGTGPVDGSWGPVLEGMQPRPPLTGGAGLEMSTTLYDHAAAAADELVAWIVVMITVGVVGIFVVRRRLAR